MLNQKANTQEPIGSNLSVLGAQVEKIPTNFIVGTPFPLTQLIAGAVESILQQQPSLSYLGLVLEQQKRLLENYLQIDLYASSIKEYSNYPAISVLYSGRTESIFITAGLSHLKLSQPGMCKDLAKMVGFLGVYLSQLNIEGKLSAGQLGIFETTLPSDISPQAARKKQSPISEYYTVKISSSTNQQSGSSKAQQTIGRLVRGIAFRLWVWGSQMLKFAGFLNTPKD